MLLLLLSCLLCCVVRERLVRDFMRGVRDYLLVKPQKAVYLVANAPQGGTQKYTLTFAYDSLR